MAIVLSSKRSGAASWVIDKSRTRSYPPQRVQQSLTDSSDVLKSYGCAYNISTCALSIVWGKGCPLDTALQQQLWIDGHRASASALGHHSNHHRARPLNTIVIIFITHRQVAIISRWIAHLLRWIAHPQELASLTSTHTYAQSFWTQLKLGLWIVFAGSCMSNALRNLISELAPLSQSALERISSKGSIITIIIIWATPLLSNLLCFTSPTHPLTSRSHLQNFSTPRQWRGIEISLKRAFWYVLYSLILRMVILMLTLVPPILVIAILKVMETETHVYHRRARTLRKVSQQTMIVMFMPILMICWR